MEPTFENGIGRKDDGQHDMIAFDNPDDTIQDLPKQTVGSEKTLVAVDNPDDFLDEEEKATQTK